MSKQASANYSVTATWDSKALVWVAKGVNVKGLNVHGRNREELVEKLLTVIPPLVRANEGDFHAGTLEIVYHGNEMIPISLEAA